MGKVSIDAASLIQFAIYYRFYQAPAYRRGADYHPSKFSFPSNVYDPECNSVARRKFPLEAQPLVVVYLYFVFLPILLCKFAKIDYQDVPMATYRWVARMNPMRKKTRPREMEAQILM